MVGASSTGSPGPANRLEISSKRRQLHCEPGAEEGTRTLTSLRSLAPQASVSTNSTTSAGGLSSLHRQRPASRAALSRRCPPRAPTIRIVIGLAAIRCRVDGDALMSRHAAAGLRRASELAEDRGDRWIMPVHLMLGLLVDPRSTAARLLDLYEVSATRLGSQLWTLLPPGRRPPAGQPARSCAVNACLRLGHLEAEAMGLRRLGTEHLLIGILRDGDGLVACTLREHGLSVEGLRGAIRREHHPAA